MKHLLKKFEIKRLLVVALAAFACVGMWGCYDDPCDDMEYRWTGPTEKKIVGFVNDSFAIVAHANRWSYEADCMCSGERFGLGRWTIGVYNYREQLDGPVFVDSVDDGYGQYMYVLGQLSDSVVWGGNTDPNLLVWKNATSFSFWKIGEKPHIIGVRQSFDGCSVSFPIGSLREWTDGAIFAKGNLTTGNDSCQYAVLDTVSGVLTYKRLDEDLMWIQKCDDVRAWGYDVYCSLPGKRPLEGNILKNEKDTILAPLVFSKGIFWGNMIELRANICNLGNQEISCLDSTFTWREPLKFYKGNDVVVDLE
ncbi:hypothetical protein [Fibrobacter sp.]|uniref:hypothetical protein n=1 Tax=Fibrobacter sp. TaxID=35828 RepID=UPI00388FE2BF